MAQGWCARAGARAEGGGRGRKGKGEGGGARARAGTGSGGRGIRVLREGGLEVADHGAKDCGDLPLQGAGLNDVVGRDETEVDEPVRVGPASPRRALRDQEVVQLLPGSLVAVGLEDVGGDGCGRRADLSDEISESFRSGLLEQHADGSSVLARQPVCGDLLWLERHHLLPRDEDSGPDSTLIFCACAGHDHGGTGRGNYRLRNGPTFPPEYAGSVVSRRQHA